MSSIEALKEKARRHEQKEEWQKALDHYQKAIDKLAEDEQPDIGLYNRVGDLQTRIGNLEAAVEAYEEAVDLYVETELPNNAIAVCKKIIRNMPQRNAVYLKMGQIRASQGFLVDARQNFLTYAERMQADGDMDSALGALIEFADLAPDDVGIRMAIAGQLEQHGRTDEAVEQLTQGYRTLMEKGNEDEAKAFEAKIRELDPTAADNLDAAIAGAEALGFGTDDLGAGDGGFTEMMAEGDAGPVEAEVGGDFSFDIQTDEGGDDEADLAMLDFGEGEEEGEEPAEELPMMSFDDDGGEEEAEELPLMGFDEEGEAVEELPMMSFDDDEEEEEAEAVEGAFDASAFGEADRGDRELKEYVDGTEEMGELEVGLDLDLDEGAEEEAEEEAAPPEMEEPAEAMAEMVEDTVADARAEAGEPAATGDPSTLLEFGRQLLGDGSIEDGLAQLKAAQEAFDAAGNTDGAMDATRAMIEAQPDEVSHRQRLVELAFQKNDDRVLGPAYLDLAKCLDRGGQKQQAMAVFQQVLSVDPDNSEAREALESAGPAAAPVREVASSESYVDLGSMILDEEEEEKTTRFTVAYEEPTGDEQADFTKMLGQFKAKVAETFSADDVKAHHDLGTAYKEMGLLDEAIEEFQQALRASSHHLPTYELLGQVFMEKGEHDAAVRSLARALESPFEVEDELLGIYYYLGRAHEELGNTDQAVEYYDRVFSLDINFADVTERLRALR